MTDWLSASGRITNLSKDEITWLKAQEDHLEGIAHVVRADKLAIEEYGRYYLAFMEVPQDGAVDILQAFLKRFRPTECFTVTWACESGAYYGGGACLISAKTDLWNHAGDWAEKQEEEFYRRHKAKKAK